METERIVQPFLRRAVSSGLYLLLFPLLIELRSQPNDFRWSKSTRCDLWIRMAGYGLAQARHPRVHELQFLKD